MREVTTLIVGAGQAGLAMSRSLSSRSIDHVLLERGDVAASWRTERWDSLRLLTPNWLNGLPGHAYQGPEPDGFMTVSETIGHLDSYAARIDAPVQTQTSVISIGEVDGGYCVQTNQGPWQCRSLVIASGACNIATRPRWAAELPACVHSLTGMEYRRPDDIGQGGVLVVGGSATGVQLARELQLSGRQVTLATGEHVRTPRNYRGRDITYWMAQCGILDRRIEDADDTRRARRVPSLQLMGGSPAVTVDLNSLQEIGVQIAGRAMGYSEGRIQLSGSLANVCELADLKMNRMLDEIDAWIADAGLESSIEPYHRFAPTRVPADPMLSLELERSGIETVIWATGYRPDYSWLTLPVFGPRGDLLHDCGVVNAPGVYVLGLPFMRTRKSSFIGGAGEDAEAIATHLHQFLARSARAAA